MRTDAQGLAVSSAGEAEILAIDVFRRELLLMNGHNDGVIPAAQAAPQCGLLQTYAALFFLYGGTAATLNEAHSWLERADRAGREATERERLLLAAAQAWAASDTERVMDLTEEITRKEPRDLVAAKICEFQYYVAGQHHECERFLTHMERIAPSHPDDADVMAMHSFSLELSGRYDEARAKGERSVERRFATPWAHHALSHIAIVTGDYRRGIEEQEKFRPAWDNPGPSIHGHDAWHLALLHLARGDHSAAWALFDDFVWGHLPESTGEQTDATSLLWRLEMAGVEVPAERWRDVANAGAPLADEAVFPFVSIHLAYALARAGRDHDVGRIVAAAGRAAAGQPPARQRVWNEVGIPAMKGAIAFARNDMHATIEAFEGVATQIPRLGGSDAQDDLFRLTLVSALRRAGRASAADALLPLFPGRRTRV